MRDRLRTAAVSLLVGTTLLAGCSQPQQPSTTLPSAAPTPTAEALLPLGPPEFPVPVEARTKDAAGAEAFTRYWVDLLNRQQAIPDGGPIRELGPECDECLRIARVFDDAAAAGHGYKGGTFTITSAAPALLKGDEALVSFVLMKAAVQRLDTSGAVDSGQPADDDLSSGITLRWSRADRGWFVIGMTIG